MGVTPTQDIVRTVAQAAPAPDPSFWIWTGVAAMCAVLVLLGTATDWVLRARQKDAILATLRRFETKLASAPIRDWQIAIARCVISSWWELGKAPLRVYATWYRLVRRSPILNWTRVAVGRLEERGQVFVPVALATTSVAWVALVVPFIIVLVIVAAGVCESWFLLVACVPAVCYGAMIPLLLAAVTAEVRGAARMETWLSDHVLILLLGTLQPSCVMSAIFSIIATLAGLAIGGGHTGSYWFHPTGQGLHPAHPILITTLNFPFDLMTVLISIKLLDWVAERGKWIVFIALIDIVISAALVILLHMTLKIIETGSVMAIGHHFVESCSWFWQVVTFNASTTHPDWPLTPLLLTTFIPVTLYMSAFIILGIILKPFAWVAGYLCGLLGEKEKTPFAELAVIISLLGATAKALSEWGWLRHVLSGG
jgi:hypothetical protein